MLFINTNVHLSLVVHVVEVLSDPWFGALALDVPSGGSGAGEAGGQAARGTQTPPAQSRCPENRHLRTQARTVPNKREGRTACLSLQDKVTFNNLRSAFTLFGFDGFHPEVLSGLNRRLV